jgi:hypothetical protein
MPTLEETVSEENTYTESQAQLHFAKQFNGKAWGLLEKDKRTPEENEQLVDYAHASLAHWRSAGTGVHLQRGSWMLARIYTELGNVLMAVQHAERCLEMTEKYKGELSDFDFAFAYECMARAQGMAKNQIEAKNYLLLAQEAGEAIKDEEDREIFFGDFNEGEWYGIR